MESNIMLEGFKKSIEMHILKYDKIIGDGDSSHQSHPSYFHSTTADRQSDAFVNNKSRIA
jgi:hypothetical protein